MRHPTVHHRNYLVRTGIVFLVVILLFGGALAAYKLTGHSLGIRSLASSLKNVAKAVLDSRKVASYRKGNYTDIIFLHHSVGHNLIEQGGIRQALTEAGFDFFDHDYNGEGLTGPDGQLRGYSYIVPADNTDIDGLAEIFRQKAYPLPVNTLSGLLQHEVIILKSCFPNSNITSDDQLTQDKAYYLEMRDVMDQHPDKLFIIVTSPPLNPAETNPEAAARARALANWLTSDEFLQGQTNLFVFDLYSLLSEDQQDSTDINMLKVSYRSGTDSHPNQVANKAIGPMFMEFIRKSIDEYRAAVANQ